MSSCCINPHRLVAYTEDQLLKVSEALASKYSDYVELHGDDDPHLRDRYLQLCEVWALGMLAAKDNGRWMRDWPLCMRAK
jgi:hypothetical protein